MHVLEAIKEGLHDEELDLIINACKARAQEIPLKAGDTIRVTDQCSPKYMSGVLGTIVTKTAKKSKGEDVYLVKVLPSEEYKLAGTKMARYSYGEWKIAEINMPRSLMMKVEAD